MSNPSAASRRSIARSSQANASGVSPKIERGADFVYIRCMAVSSQKTLASRLNAGLLAGLLLYVVSNSAFAQAGPPRMPQFEADAPKVGETLPDISIHDDLGNLVNIRELASENYKVLVLGCLT